MKDEQACLCLSAWPLCTRPEILLQRSLDWFAYYRAIIKQRRAIVPRRWELPRILLDLTVGGGWVYSKQPSVPVVFEYIHVIYIYLWLSIVIPFILIAREYFSNTYVNTPDGAVYHSVLQYVRSRQQRGGSGWPAGMHNKYNDKQNKFNDKQNLKFIDAHSKGAFYL